MPHLFSGLNQKRQSGKITSGTMIVGNSKGRGSTTRQLNHCKANSENPSNCVDTVLNINNNNIPKKNKFNPNANILFNISSFSNLFDLYDTGYSYFEGMGPDSIAYKQLDQKYITALTNAANRWNKYIRYTPEMNQFINELLFENDWGENAWKGIELFRCKVFKNKNVSRPTILAEASAYRYKSTSLNLSCYIGIYQARINELNITNINTLTDIFTHELGHVLGMPCFYSTIDGLNLREDNVVGVQLLPNSIYDNNFRSYVYQDKYFKNTIDAYNSYQPVKAVVTDYWGDIIGPFLNVTGNKNIPFFSSHWLENPIFYSYLNDSGVGNYINFIHYGLPIEMMSPKIEVGTSARRPLISKITINLLTEIYTVWKGKKYYNYYEIKKGSSEVTSHDHDDENCQIIFKGNAPIYKNVFINDMSKTTELEQEETSDEIKEIKEIEEIKETNIDDLINTPKKINIKNICDRNSVKNLDNVITCSCNCEPICIEIKNKKYTII
jgi:hypothetical protein